MFYIMTVLIVAASSVLWRVRGGLFKEYVPANKLWYAVFFGALAWFFRVGTAEYALCAGLACYAGYQAFGWGLYIGRLLGAASLSRICRSTGSVNLSTICYIPHMSRSKERRFICISIRSFSVFAAPVCPG